MAYAPPPLIQTVSRDEYRVALNASFVCTTVVYNNRSKLIDVVIYRQHVSIYIVAPSHIRVQI